MGRAVWRALASAALALAPWVATAQPSPVRQAELLALLDQDCGSCHGLTRKGGLGPSLLPADLVGKSDEALVAVILQGSIRQPMPPWGFFLDADEAAWLVRVLRAGPVDAD